MTRDASPIPVVLFAYARPDHLARVLACLRENRVPLLHVFADGPKPQGNVEGVAAVRRLLRAIDWCDVRLVERPENMGLGRNILAGVEAVAGQHNAFIVWEDDLVAVPGTYDWVCAALRQYEREPRVMSVSAWTHPRVTPDDVGDQPYLDARAECWVWGSWARSWAGMNEQTAMEKLAAVAEPLAYGADLPAMAEAEQRQNIWAVRWLYHHLQHRGLCVRPPWSMVEHIGFDASATNAETATAWANPPLRAAPPIPRRWPDPVEHAACRARWQAAVPPASNHVLRRVARRLRAGWRRLTA